MKFCHLGISRARYDRWEENNSNDESDITEKERETENMDYYDNTSDKGVEKDNSNKYNNRTVHKQGLEHTANDDSGLNKQIHNDNEKINETLKILLKTNKTGNYNLIFYSF